MKWSSDAFFSFFFFFWPSFIYIHNPFSVLFVVGVVFNFFRLFVVIVIRIIFITIIITLFVCLANMPLI